MFPKWLLLLFICLNFSNPNVSASSIFQMTNSSIIEDIAINKPKEDNSEIIKLFEKLDEMYKKREALSELYFETDKEIFELQKEILGALKKHDN
ncbi:hypothetical protein [Peribacillus loiseleuriae]|uniref:hypothetical protein n=1 Tax=Peribacillus loiseleuriae TaxID=1679170 RepID=UPI003CFCA97D